MENLFRNDSPLLHFLGTGHQQPSKYLIFALLQFLSFHLWKTKAEPCPLTPFLPPFYFIYFCCCSLIFIAIGASLPAKLRNVSSVFLTLPSKPSSSIVIRHATTEDSTRKPVAPTPSHLLWKLAMRVSHAAQYSSTVIMDCGEGTLGQLCRICGADELEALLRLASTKLVWISHLHADHHLGLPQILERYSYLFTLTHLAFRFSQLPYANGEQPDSISSPQNLYSLCQAYLPPHALALMLRCAASSLAKTAGQQSSHNVLTYIPLRSLPVIGKYFSKAPYVYCICLL